MLDPSPYSIESQTSILQHRLKRRQSAVLQGSQPHMSCRTQQQQTKKVFGKHRYKRKKIYNFTVKEKKITVSNIDLDKSIQSKKIVKDLMQCYTFLLMIIKPAVPKRTTFYLDFQATFQSLSISNVSLGGEISLMSRSRSKIKLSKYIFPTIDIKVSYFMCK